MTTALHVCGACACNAMGERETLRKLDVKRERAAFERCDPGQSVEKH